MMGRSSFGMRLLAALILVSILLVSGLGYLYFSGTRKIERRLVGVISVTGTIISSNKASSITAAINHAMLNDSVKAVVLMIDSPGGYAHLIEQIYLDLMALRGGKPVISSVTTALSGGYYIAVATDYIYAHPTSMVGNIGVVGVGPGTLIPSEMTLETGPYKATGFSKLLFPFNLTHAIDNFVEAVEAGRGDRLRLSSTELRRGKIYLGSEGVAAGLVDEVGALQSAIKHVAGEAGLVEYEVIDLQASPALGPLKTQSNDTEVEWRDITVETLNRLNPPPAVYYLYLPPKTIVEMRVAKGQETDAVNVTAPTEAEAGGFVVVDLSHGNRVSAWVLDILMAELAKRGLYLGFDWSWKKVEASLHNASGLIVAAPTEAYSPEEVASIEKFVNDGRLLIMFFDPASEYVDIPALLGPINSLANGFGLSFAKGYLYNEEEHYGLYRNIYVRQFANTSLTRNLDTLVLFTATHVRSLERGAAWTSSDTYSSTAEQSDIYAPVSIVELNGTVAAFGDLTFLMEPYCYVEDNYELILNIASALAAVEVPLEKREEPEYNVTKPDLAVGTEKVFTEQVDDEEHQITWTRVSENEIRVERPDCTTHYYLDVNGSLLWWESDGMNVTYDEPLPEPPYPLIKGKEWAYASNYSLKRDGEAYSGRLSEKGWVEGFQTVEAGDGESYFCAKVGLKEKDYLQMDGSNVTAVTTGHSWISSDAGTVKRESQIKYYVDGALFDEETRKLLMISIKKGRD